MNILELEEINRGVKLYEELKKLPLTKREKEVIVRSIFLGEIKDFEVKCFDISEKTEDKIKEKDKTVFTPKNSHVLYYYLVISEDGYFTADSVENIKWRWDLSKRMILCSWVNNSLRVFIQNKGNKEYSSYQRNIARIKGIKLD